MVKVDLRELENYDKSPKTKSAVDVLYQETAINKAMKKL